MPNNSVILHVGDDWTCTSTLSGTHTQTVRCVTWSYDDSKLTSTSFDGTTAIWEQQGGDYECSLTLEGHKDEVKCAAWSVSGLYLGMYDADVDTARA